MLFYESKYWMRLDTIQQHDLLQHKSALNLRKKWGINGIISLMIEYTYKF